MGLIQLNGAFIYYEIRGVGHPIILIAGYTCDHTVWMPIVDILASHFQVVLFDNRGVGSTKDTAKELSAELLAEDVLELSKALKLKRPHVIGQSMGGTVAQKLAATYPEEIGKLGLLITTAHWRKAMLLAMRSHLILRQNNVSEDLIFHATIPWIFGEKFLASSRNIDAIRKLSFEEPYPQSIEDQERQIAILEHFDGRAEVKKIKAPTLIMYGKEDLLSLPSDSEFLAQNIPGAKMEAFEGAHAIILEDTEKLVSSIIGFFKNS